MRICINALLIEPNRTGGGETFLVNLVSRLARFDKNNDYLILATAANQALFESDNPRITVRPAMRSATSQWRRIAYEWLIMPFLLWLNRIDVYYAPFGTLPPILPCRSVVTCQNLIYFDFAKNVPFRGHSLNEHFKAWMQYIYNTLSLHWATKSADCVWAVSKTTAAEIGRRLGISGERITVVYEGVDFGVFHAARNELAMAFRSEDRPYLLAVATLYPNKNLDKVIRAFHCLVGEGLEYDLLIVGNDWLGYRAELEKLVRTLGLTERVRFCGGVDHAAIPGYLAGARLFVLFSTVESFGLPVLEAMAAGVPVIVSDSSSLPEIAGGAALLAKAGDVEHLAKRMKEILLNSKLAETLQERGFDRARQFSWDETAVRAIDLFNQLNPKHRLKRAATATEGVTS